MLSEDVYHNLLSKGKALIILGGIVLFLAVFYFYNNWQDTYSQTMSSTITSCQYDSDCFYECGACRSVPSGQFCEDKGEKACACINGTCEISGPTGI